MTATTPVVITPSPTTGTGVISCPTCSTGGSPGGSDTQGQFNNNGSFAGSPGLIFNDSTKALVSVTGSATGGTSENVTPTIAFPYLGTTPSGNPTCQLFGQVQNTNGSSLDPSSFNFFENTTNFVNFPTQSVGLGWNFHCEGGVLVPNQSGIALLLEKDYTPGGTGAWPPTTQGVSQDEIHTEFQGISGPYYRPESCAYDTLTGYEDFCQHSHDVGDVWLFGTSDATPITGVTVTMSGATATFNFGGASASIPYNYQVASYLNIGCAFTGLPSCSNFTPSGYNGIWTIQSVGSTTLTATKAGASGLSSGSGGTVIGGGLSKYASLSPSGTTVGGVTGGWFLQGQLGVEVGGPVVVGGAGGNLGYLKLTPTTIGGTGGNLPTRMYNSGVSGTCTSGDVAWGPSSAYIAAECLNSTWQPLGTGSMGSQMSLYRNPVHTGTQPDIDLRGLATQDGIEVYSDYSTSANNCGFLQSPLGAGGSIFYAVGYQRGTCTSLTTMLMGGYSGVAASFRGGATQGLYIDTSGNVGYGSGATAGVTVSGILCTASFATVQGGVTACTATSDPRLKDYEPLPYGLDAIMHIQPIKFRWNELGRKYNANDTTEHLGFNAQNIQQVMPEAVGTETHDGTDYLSLPHGTDGIVAALVKAVQEQQAQIEQLKSEVAQLKAAR